MGLTGFDAQPTLKGKLLELRPLLPADFGALFAIGSDPLVWEQHPEHDRYTEAKFRAFFDDGVRNGGALLALDARTGKAIGSSRYRGHDEAASEVEIGWSFLARAYWGGEYNGEMKDLMLRHAFRFVNRVVFLIGPENIRSQRAVEKIGGVRAGTRIDTRRNERVVYAITKESWLQR